MNKITRPLFSMLMIAFVFLSPTIHAAESAAPQSDGRVEEVPSIAEHVIRLTSIRDITDDLDSGPITASRKQDLETRVGATLDVLDALTEDHIARTKPADLHVLATTVELIQDPGVIAHLGNQGIRERLLGFASRVHTHLSLPEGRTSMPPGINADLREKMRGILMELGIDQAELHRKETAIDVGVDEDAGWWSILAGSRE